MEYILYEAIIKFYGESGQLISLGSCQDLNYRLTTIEGKKYVVKVVKPQSTFQELIELTTIQHGILLHLSKTCPDYECPVPTCTKDQSNTFALIELGGQSYLLQLLSYVEGSLLSKLKYYAPETLFSFGAMVAKVHIALHTCNARLENQTQWDPRRSMEVIRGFVADQDPLLMLSQQLFDIITAYSPAFRVQVLHGDLAPYNVLISESNFHFGQPIICGVIDFGDVTEGWLIGDLSIAIAPLLSLSPEHNQHPLKTTLHVLKGYLTTQSLLEQEALALWPLLVLRVILLRLSIKHLLQEDPQNAYLAAENIENAKLLDAVLQIPFSSAVQAILILCGFSPQHSTDVQSALSESSGVLFKNIAATLEWLKVDFSCESEVYQAGGQWLTEQNLTTYLTPPFSTEYYDKVYYVEIGKPWLFRTKLRSATAPLTMPTFDLFHIPATIDFDGNYGISLVIPTVQDKQNVCKDCLVYDHEVSYHALEITCSQWKMNVIALDNSSQLTYDFRLHRLNIVQADSYNGYVTIGVQWYMVDLVLDSSYCQQQSVSGPPLFCTLFDWQYLWQPLSLTLHLPLSRSIDSDCADHDLGRVSALDQRTQYAANIQELYYSSLADDIENLPPMIIRGYGAYLYSYDGRALLDMVNNVAVIGHSHPHITTAVTKQLNLLNTNSRFLYPQLGNFAQEVIKTMPQEAIAMGKLNKVIFVNSGSEATDLALRIARTVISYRQHKQRRAEDSQAVFKWYRDVICLQGGYHGVTTASDEVSTTLNDNPQALESRPEWINLVPMPNAYRGLYRHTLPSTETLEQQAAKYAEHVQSKIAQLAAQDRPIAAFICEPLSGNAGGVLLPPTYLKQVYQVVHAAGGLCICDEVQAGYGRLGSAFWGFMTPEHDLLPDIDNLPDIVTVAKAAGNGHPLGYVILSEALAEEFYHVQGSFFSSAGGGPVSCAIGSVVLKTVQDEGLMENARSVGAYIQEKLLLLKEKHSKIIGYIHGQGLYQGIEIISTAESQNQEAPAPPGTKEAALICRRLLQLGVICHNTGDYSNVLKVKPPLCFSYDDGDFFVAMLDKVCSEGW